MSNLRYIINANMEERITTTQRDLLIATTNLGKQREFDRLLGALPLRVQSLRDHPGAPPVDETGATYLENATLKAITTARWSGLLTLADDSGLEVEALHGAPGVHSARYAGPQQDDSANVRKLLAALDGLGLTEAQRSARFRCVIVVATPQGTICSAEGTCDGLIALTPAGCDGFGYDPVFFSPTDGCTFAQLDAMAKNAVSHRAAACRVLVERLPAFLKTIAD